MIKILMCGNHPSNKGGMTSVISQILSHDWKNKNIQMRFIQTFYTGNSITEISYFIISCFRIFLNLLFNKPDIEHMHMSYKGSFTRKYLIHKLCKVFNYDCHKASFMDEAYNAKKWAFVSDYARFDILNQYGGIYFDTDVELLKPIQNEMLNKNAFTGIESSGKVSPGLVFATIPNSLFLKEILTSYNNAHFIIDGKPNFKTVNEFTTELLVPKGFVNGNKYKEVYDVAIYPSEYFCAYDQDVKEYEIKPETISVHHYAGTWTKKSLGYNLKMLVKK